MPKREPEPEQEVELEQELISSLDDIDLIQIDSETDQEWEQLSHLNDEGFIESAPPIMPIEIDFGY